MIRILATTMLIGSTLAATTNADNWAHWRGPTGNGVAPNGNPPTHWSATENVKWKAPIPGKGSGSPVIWEGFVFVVSAVPTASQPSTPAASAQPPQRRNQFQRGAPRGPLPNLDFKLFCFDRETGKLLWQRTAITATPHQETHSTNGFASASPCTDGSHVYAHFGSRGLYCYTMDGELKWKRQFGKMTTRSGFGEGSSPTLIDDKIIVPWDHEGDSALYALNKLTGEIIWKTERDEPSCWATPLIVEHDGQQQIVMNGQNYARCYDLKSGKELWKCAGQTQRPVASAVASGNRVWIGSGYQGSFLGGFKLGGSGDIEGTEHVVWTISRDTPDIASPLLSGNRLYFHKGKSAMLTCVDAATGKPHYESARLPDISRTYASPIVAGGHVYLTGRSGTTVVIKDSDQLSIVATNSVDETVDATPAPAGDQLFIRGENHLFCIAE